MATRRTLQEFIGNLKTMSKDFNKVGNEILDELVEISINEIKDSVSSSDYTASDPVEVFKESKKKKRITGIRGEQSIYDEFGTGTMGANNPHPDKSEYNLNDYNSGHTIRVNKSNKMSENSISQATMNGIPENGLYWTYNYNGKKIYTQGRPAGMHVYKGHKAVKKNMQKIIDRKVGDILSKL